MIRYFMVGSLLLSISATGCTHRVEVAAPEPITINLNVKIEHEVRVKVEKDLDDLFSDESKELF
ncbi:MAG: YnbE family lipoprotein [Ketobacteraceae bacterium]|nr:YnbE family lipoprotein [Ketobacteraceae bacterium]